jgi:NAD-reducing hydrogenase large subunit
MATTTKSGRKIVINPVTRVEGHGKVTIYLNDKGEVAQARMHIVEFRGFERFVLGRLYWEVPVIIQRLCGICPVSHLLAAAKAMDVIVGADRLPPTAEKMRRLMHYGQTYQSHALHFFHLASPDLLLGIDSPPATRNVIGLALANPELATRAVLMRKWGQEIIRCTAGKKIHGNGAIPGGVNKNLSVEERDFLAKDADTMLAWAVEGLELFKGLYRKEAKWLADFGSFESNFVSIVRKDGCLDLYDGLLRARDPDGKIIFDGVAPAEYAECIAEEVRSWSYMKFPFIRRLGKEKGWYRVGPLARLNNCDFIDTPIAERERKEFRALGGRRPVHATMAYHWARLVELVHAAEKIKELLADPVLQGTELTAFGSRRGRAVAWIEAPRGTLFHNYEVDANDQVTMANLIVSTTSNNEPMNQAVLAVARSHLAGKKEITEGMLNAVEVAIRAYDPCLSCATHAVGKMPLVVSLFDGRGELIGSRTRS